MKREIDHTGIEKVKTNKTEVGYVFRALSYVRFLSSAKGIPQLDSAAATAAGLAPIAEYLESLLDEPLDHSGIARAQEEEEARELVEA